MLISPPQLQRYWKLSPSVVLHVGAHTAEELEPYSELGWGKSGTYWVEANPDLAAELQQRLSDQPHHHVIQAVAWKQSGETINFSFASNGQSSSALPFAEHSSEYPDITVVRQDSLKTTALDDLPLLNVLQQVNLINLDIQGAELQALQGMSRILNHVDAIYSEVNTRNLYEGCAQLPELDKWLQTRGFIRVDLQLTANGWGDALYLRRNFVPRFVVIRRMLRKLDGLLHRGFTSLKRRLRS